MTTASHTTPHSHINNIRRAVEAEYRYKDSLTKSTPGEMYGHLWDAAHEILDENADISLPASFLNELNRDILALSYNRGPTKHLTIKRTSSRTTAQ